MGRFEEISLNEENKNSLKISEFREMKNVYFDVDPISVV